MISESRSRFSLLFGRLSAREHLVIGSPSSVICNVYKDFKKLVILK